ncbi:MAG: beta strand repeat-containing protein, partial [Erythrobacteraceae bacterium]
SLSIGGDAIAFAQGEGGDGGQSDGQAIVGGRGGDGYGGEFTLPNQADPAFNSGVFILAGGDNGTIRVTGEARALASGFGGRGGNGESIQPGGRGGDGFGGLAQVGLALLGQNGSVGQGSATFATLFAEAIASGGRGGFSIGDFPSGNGGNATGGNAFLTLRAGTLTTDSVELDARAYGGEGANGGNATGGIAASFGSLGGRLTTDAFIARASGFGGFGGADIDTPGNGGNGVGGRADLDFQGITVQITGDARIEAEGEGGGTGDFTAGNGTGGTARLGVLGTIAGSGTITGNTIVSANGFGGGANNGVGSISGDGTGNGGNAYIGQNLFEIVNASATIIGQAAIFDQSQGGNGQQGGSVFTVNPLTGLRGSLNIVLDNANITFTPDASGVAGIGGDFVTRGGTGVVRGGDAQGPDFNVTINQTNLSGGQLRINPFIQGGDATALDGIGGNAFGSLVNIAITNSQLTLPGETLLAADALGGAGGANGTGGSGTSGAVDVTITGSTLNLVADQQGVPGSLRISAQGNGRLGAQVGDGTSNRAVLNLVNSAITATQVQINAQGSAGASGGLGGDAIGGEARLSLAGTSAITADLLSLNSSASTGQGGTATGGVSAIDVGTGATATLTVPQVVLSADGQTSANDLGGIAGVTQGGQSRIGASGGSLTITGNAIVNANGTGAIAGSILTGAVARAGQARVFAAQGGSLSIGGNLTVAADAFGSRGSLGNASSVSDAYGGNAFINVFGGGGSISIGGDAFASASAFGGSSNNAGAGSIGDAGQAIANIDGGGQITITGALLVEADGIGGDNAGGTGGVGLGGRASSAIFSGGTIDIGLDFRARADGGGGGGQTGGDGFGGI